jgi:FkbM family methyltransferase
MKIIKDYVRNRPALYDRVRRLKRRLTGAEAASLTALSRFSQAHEGRVNFIQIGANDGLRNDPLRPLIVDADWQGVLIEPLPTVFPLLQRNYAHLDRPHLVFLNAAVTAEASADLEFWSFKPEFLATLPLEQRLDYLRKASFERDHVAGFVPAGVAADAVLQAVQVPCLSLEQVVDTHLPRRPLHLLAIDVEGYEATLIPGIDFVKVAPEAVFFEAEHLGEHQARVFGHLEAAGYEVTPVGLDALAILRRPRAAGSPPAAAPGPRS